MTLIPIWEGKIKLPSFHLKKRIGNNNIFRLIIPEINEAVSLYESESPNYYKIVTSLDPPLNHIYLKKKRGKADSSLNRLTLSSNLKEPINEIFPNSRFKWTNVLESKLNSFTPEQVLENWQDKFKFKKENEQKKIDGLRTAQLGALHAISAHFSTGTKFDPATIVLPTGTGKTETMLSALVYNLLPKVMVVVPSKVLRDQIGNKFISLGILPEIGVLPFTIQRPWVAIIKKSILNESDASEIAKFSNVIIATPQIISKSNPNAIKILFNECTDLFIDEAHHSPAETWNKIREQFHDKRISQFTATPFRNDENEIGGKIIYNYKLGDAQKDNYYKPIRFFPIEEFGVVDDADSAIARKAVEILREDLAEPQSYDHLLMVRVKGIPRADLIQKIYAEIAPEFNPVVVHSQNKKLDNQLSLSKILERSSRIIICVDMLGEGFDLPQLKIAAIHDYHKSLAITLQFVGRFTRKSKNVGDAAVILNIADPEVDKGIEKLYSANASWDELIRRLSEEKIDREIRIQEIVENLKQSGTLSSQVSIRSLRPTFTTQVYKVKTNKWSPLEFKEVLPKKMTTYHSLSNTQKILIILGIHESDVKWGRVQEINDILHKLFIAYWNEKESALFVYCNDYSGFKVEAIIQKIFNKKVELVSGPKIFNVLNNVELPLVKNLGSSKTGVISFTQYFGPNVTEGLSEIEKHQSNLSNIACLGYEEGEKVLWGAAQKKGKIWSVKSGNIEDWMDWCNRIWKKVISITSPDNITQNFLRPIQLKTYHTLPAISIDWGEKLHLKSFDKVFLVVNGEEYPLYLVDLDVLEIGVIGPIKISFITSKSESTYELKIDEQLESGYEYKLISGFEVNFRIGRSDLKPLQEHVISDPFNISYSDGSYSYNNYLIQPNLEPDVFNKESIEIWDWDKIPLNKESMGKERSTATIQYRTFENVKKEFQVVFNDDDKGEAADLIGLTQVDEKTINLTLIHCKNAINNKPGADIRDLYTVCGQAQKSIKVKHKGLKELYYRLKNRENKWREEGHSRFLKGELKDLEFFKNKSRVSKIDFDIVIVQPGLSKSKVGPDILRLLATTELYIKKTCQGNLRVIGNK